MPGLEPNLFAVAIIGIGVPIAVFAIVRGLVGRWPSGEHRPAWSTELGAAIAAIVGAVLATIAVRDPVSPMPLVLVACVGTISFGTASGIALFARRRALAWVAAVGAVGYVFGVAAAIALALLTR